MEMQRDYQNRSLMGEKAIQKFPFNINDVTYFSSECYHEDTIVNGISLEVKQGKGIENETNTVDYLTYSNRLIFYAGCNLLSYNSYKRKYEFIHKANNLLAVKGTSMVTGDKEYIAWMEKEYIGGDDTQRFYYVLSIYDANQKKKIYSEMFTNVEKQLKSEDNIQLLIFMQPYKVLGFVFTDKTKDESFIVFKKMVRPNQETEFGPETCLKLNYQILNIKYDLQSNSYLLKKNKFQIWCIQCSNQKIEEEDQDNRFIQKNQYRKIYIKKLLSLRHRKDLKQILHFAISELYLLLLIIRDNNQRHIEVYSVFSYTFIFSHVVWYGCEDQDLNQSSREPLEFDDDEKTPEIAPIHRIQLSKNVIIGLRETGRQITIFNLVENQIKHVKDAVLNISNCYKLEKIFINPFSSEVLVMSRHYQLQGAFSRQSQMKYKSFFLEVSSFFLTVEVSFVEVQQIGIRKINYFSILTAPWMTQYLVQTDNSVRSLRWQQKFDSPIRCSALHPTSQYIALGFNDSFKIYFVTFEGLAHTCVTENVKECISVAYSKLGHDFAVATGTNIFIYNSYSYEKKFQISLGISYRIEQIKYFEGWHNNKPKESLKCVTNNKRIVIYNAIENYSEQFSFNPKNHLDQNIIDAALCQMKPNRKNLREDSLMMMVVDNFIGENTPAVSTKKGFGSILYDEKVGVVIFSFGTKIYFISTLNFQCLGCYDFEEVTCMQLCRELDTLFMGTATGKIIGFPWPNKPLNITSRIPTYWVHKTKIKKIKLSVNSFELVSITDESIYVHHLTFIQEMRKIQKYELQRQFNPKSLLAIDFFLKMGYCLFTVDKMEQKVENIKEIQQEAINVNFMLPEEREKQKITVINKIQVEKKKVAFDAHSEMVPLKIESINIKDKIKNIEKEITEAFFEHEQKKEKEIQAYQKQISIFSIEKDELRSKHSETLKNLDEEMRKNKDEIKKQFNKTQAIYRAKLEEVTKQVNDASFESSKNAEKFFELPEMDEEKKILSQVIIKDIESQINVLLQRNGYLSCRNSNLQKDIRTKRRKIDDIKQLVQNTQRSIKNMQNKNRIVLKPETIKQQSLINKQFSDTEKRYLKETKKLIEKNKAINVSIELYEREREMLIVLEDELEKFENNIEELLRYIMSEREQKRKIKDKLAFIKEKTEKIGELYQAKNAERIKMKNTLNEYLYQLTLFQEGVIDLQQLKKCSQMKGNEAMLTPRNIRMEIEDKKRKINKIQSAEEKIQNVMKNQRKIYSNEKKKSGSQNQDLLVNFNFLLHENKELLNKIKDQHDRKANCMKNMRTRQEIKIKRLNTKPTPFQQYIQMKSMTRRLKTTPCAEYSLEKL